MFRKLFVALILVISMILPAGSALAGNPPSWDVVFKPAETTGNPYTFIHSVEVFKNNLYAVAGDPGWLHWGEPVDNMYGQVFRSADGENWQPASEPGFGLGALPDEQCGTPYYETSWDMTVFQNKLYIAPYDGCALRPGVIMRSSDGKTWQSVVTTEELGATWDDTAYAQFHKLGVFKGMIYANAEYWDENKQLDTAQIYRSPNGNPGTWTKVKELPTWYGAGSFKVYKGALYMASDGRFNHIPDTDTWTQLNEQIIRSVDGVNWEVVYDGANYGVYHYETLGGFADYKGYLYVGDGVPLMEGETQPTPMIWRTQDGKKWEKVSLAGFDFQSTDYKVDGLVVYLGYLYAYTVNWDEGASVYRTKDGKTWERVNEPGWGNPAYAASHLQSDQAVFKDELYLGIVGQEGAIVRLNHP